MEGQEAERIVSLRALFPQSRFFGGDDVVGAQLVSDPMECGPGVILAITSDCDDPLAVACQGLARGAAGLITENILPVPLPQCVVRDVDRTVLHLAERMHGSPAEGMLMIGVVGAHGKTTTALLASAVLRGQGQRTAYETDLGSCDGVIQSAGESRPREALEMVQFLADARDSGCAAVVLELDDELISSAIGRGLPLDVVILTGEGGTSASALPARGLDLALEQLREGGVAIVNADSPAAMSAADRAGVPILTFGMRAESHVSGKIFDQQPGQTTLMVTAGDVTTVLETALTGPAMASCQLAALALGMLIEAPLHTAIESVRRVRVIPGRMQRLGGWGNPAVVMDRGGDSKRLRNILRGLRRERGTGQLWVVAALDYIDDGVEMAACGRVAEKFADRVIVTTSPTSKDRFLSAAHDWLDGVRDAGGPRLVADRHQALVWAVEQASEDDTILVVGGWSTDSPGVERASLECEAELIESLLERRQRLGGKRGSVEPIILPHPALKG